MKLCFERAMKNALYPVIRRKNRRLEKVFKTDTFYFETTAEKPFNFSVPHLLMINIIHDIICKGFFNKNNNGFVPRGINDPVVYKYRPIIDIYELEEEYDHITKSNGSLPIKDYAVPVSYPWIANLYPFIPDLGMAPSVVLKLLSEIASCSFGLILKERYLLWKEYETKTGLKGVSVDTKAKVLSTVGRIPSKLFSVHEDRLVRNGRGLVNFIVSIDLLTFYGLLVTQSIATLNLDWIPEEIYTSKVNEYAKLFYLFFLVGKQKEEPLKLTEIVKRLLLTDSHIDQADKTVSSIIEKLGKAGFVKDYRIIGKIKNRRYEITPSKI